MNHHETVSAVDTASAVVFILCLCLVLLSGPVVWYLSDHCYLGETAGCVIYTERRSQGIMTWP